MPFDGNFTDLAGNTGITQANYSFLTNQKFGQQAVKFGSNGGVTVPLTSKITYAGDFTIETWVSMGSLTGEQMLITAGAGCYIDCYTGGAYNGGAPCFIVSINPTNSHASMIVVGNSWTVGTLHHLALCRSGSTVTLYGDGAVKGTVTNTNVWANSNWTIGNYTSSPLYGFSGGVQQVRASNVCRYTGPFTPPSSPFVLD
ncbi:hypothetical protein [Burkholderia phage FLC6]|nr:hypothetical protein [Burkholderia phage FLC6]